MKALSIISTALAIIFLLFCITYGSGGSANWEQRNAKINLLFALCYLGYSIIGLVKSFKKQKLQ